MATEVDLFEAVEAADVSRVADIVAQGEIDFSQTDRRVGLSPVRRDLRCDLVYTVAGLVRRLA